MAVDAPGALPTVGAPCPAVCGGNIDNKVPLHESHGLKPQSCPVRKNGCEEGSMTHKETPLRCYGTRRPICPLVVPSSPIFRGTFFGQEPWF